MSLHFTHCAFKSFFFIFQPALLIFIHSGSQYKPYDYQTLCQKKLVKKNPKILFWGLFFNLLFIYSFIHFYMYTHLRGRDRQVKEEQQSHREGPCFGGQRRKKKRKKSQWSFEPQMYSVPEVIGAVTWHSDVPACSADVGQLTSVFHRSLGSAQLDPTQPRCHIHPNNHSHNHQGLF